MPSDGAIRTILYWGILAPGSIAQDFVRDLQLDPASRGVSDVAHKVVAVASGSGKQKADGFVQLMYDTAELKEQAKAIKTYGSYAELAQNSDVQAIYIASPQSHHFEQVKLCLDAGKHVLCEKPLTITAEQTRALTKLAKQRGLFFMEARWTKFMDIFKTIKKLVHEDKVLGKVWRVHSDFGQFIPEGHRLYKAELGGGGLLDCGIYPLTWISNLLWDHPENARQMPRITGSMRINKYGVDEDTTAVLQFDQIDATGLLTVNLRVDLHRPAFHTIIQGEKGDILVHGTHTSRPTGYTIALRDQKPQRLDPEIPGWGMMWEADECARCIARGDLESSIMSHEESVYSMEVMDEIRKQGGLVFPNGIEEIK